MNYEDDDWDELEDWEDRDGEEVTIECELCGTYMDTYLEPKVLGFGYHDTICDDCKDAKNYVNSRTCQRCGHYDEEYLEVGVCSHCGHVDGDLPF